MTLDGQDFGGGMTGRVTLKGDIDVTIAEGVVVRVHLAEITFAGAFSEQLAPFRLTLEGAHGELRKLGPVHPRIASMLTHAAEYPADATGTLVLEADEAHVAALRDAARGTDDSDMKALVENVAWMTLVFKLDGYRVISIGTVTRTVG